MSNIELKYINKQNEINEVVANIIAKHSREINIIHEEIMKLVILNMEDQLKSVETSSHNFRFQKMSQL